MLRLPASNLDKRHQKRNRMRGLFMKCNFMSLTSKDSMRFTRFRRYLSIILSLALTLSTIVILPLSATAATVDWATLYQNYIQSHIEWQSWGAFWAMNDDVGGCELSLIDLDHDQFPELVIGFGAKGMCSVFTAKSGVVVRYGVLYNTGKFTLYQNKSTLSYIYVTRGPGDDGYGTQVNECRGVTQKEKFLTLPKPNRYYVDGKKVSKSTYTSKYKAYFNKLKLISNYDFYNFGNGAVASAFAQTETAYRVGNNPLPDSLIANSAKLPKSASMYIGDTLQLNATVIPSTAAVGATWTSSKTAIAVVSQSGLLTGLKAGKTTITYKTRCGRAATCTVTVKVRKVSSVRVTSNTNTLVSGDTLQLTAMVLPANATNKAVKWSTSNKKVATVNASGRITGLRVGTATITATAADGSKKKFAYKVKVVKRVIATGIVLSPASLTLDIGKTQTLTAKISPSNVTDQSIAWSSDNTAVATVSSSGVVTAVSAGSATITAKTSNGKTATCAVTSTPAVTFSNPTQKIPPATHPLGQTFTVVGTVITASANITSLTAGIYGAKTFTKTVYPNVTSYTFNAEIDNEMKFSQLTEGDYVYKISVMAGGVTKDVVNYPFKVASIVSNIQFPLDTSLLWYASTYVGHGGDSPCARSSAVDITLANKSSCSGKPVYAAQNGVVYHDQYSASNGQITILHDVPLYTTNGKVYQKWYSVYAHMTNISVKTGDRVTKGQQIGRVGAVGLPNPNDSHLHLQISTYITGSIWEYYNGTYSQAISPYYVLGFVNQACTSTSYVKLDLAGTSVTDNLINHKPE